ncbi:hypothetical protein PGH26_04195 [Sporosarcina jeotgali]|uniref:Uncharacterized protein n=1 Tax=Sporosarcina jeotgali TaxID=3020056 RepID=A0ABZ0KZS9_9BACL|nr:hypothetical protein [Sporosarcina sp. B2O-1]WOV85138.1 hypothetical protein PGH26_04195 [Sporosarcina sp. B2O-1]
MGEKMLFYFDPEDRHWNNLMKSVLNDDKQTVTDGSSQVFLYNNKKMIEWADMADHCVRCMASLVYNEEFDSVYCASCDEWREVSCEDPSCDYCGDRPAKPSMCHDSEES